LKHRYVAAISLVCLVLSACATERARQTVASPSPTSPSPQTTPEATIESPEAATEAPGLSPEWDTPLEVDYSSGDVSIEAFNVFLDEADPLWAQSPLRASIEFLLPGESSPDARTTTVRMASPLPEGGDEVSVTLVRDGLADDSVGATRYDLDLVRQGDGSWRLSSATWAQRCHPGRGHQDFSTELCV
jgi:hypothetical protein